MLNEVEKLLHCIRSAFVLYKATLTALRTHLGPQLTVCVTGMMMEEQAQWEEGRRPVAAIQGCTANTRIALSELMMPNTVRDIYKNLFFPP